MASSVLRDWWDRLSDSQRAILKSAAAQYRLDKEPAAQMLADTGCPVRSAEPPWDPTLGPSRVWIMPEFIRGFITDRA
jgi:hypothetical protein